MTSGTPFIGSKISLISRAEIRYEGILYQVDTKESTVTLAKVRSFGTESRQSTKHIPPRSEVYEFIIFRASDIKDLNVSEMPEEPNSPPQDPAILSAQSTAPAPIPPSTVTPAPVGSTHPQPAHPPPHHSFPPGAPPPYFSHPPMPPGGYTPFGMPYYRPPIMMGAGGPHPVPPGMSHPQNRVTIEGVVPPHVSVIGAPPAQSYTPPRPFPNTSPGLMATPTYAPAVIEAQPQASSTPVVSLATEPTQVALESVVPSTTTANVHSENVTRAPESSEPRPSSQPREPGQADTQRKEQREQGNFTEKRRQQGQAKLDRGRGNSNRGNRGYYRGRRDYYRNDGDGRDGSRGGGRGYSQQRFRGGSYNHRQQPNQDTAAKPTPFKYDSDFDFESANARFSKENLAKEFKEKLRVDSTSRKSSESYGEGEEVSMGSDDEVVIVEEEGGAAEDVEEEEYYDRSKSFFDNISCEVSSAKQRYSRNEEKEVNMQTFGVSGSNRGYGYRSRRGGRWRGRGGYRGGRNRYGGGGWSNEGSGRGGYNGEGGRGGYNGEGGRGSYNGEGGRGGYNRGYRNQQHHPQMPANEGREA